jgi:PAS domain S-box-containing protein
MKESEDNLRQIIDTIPAVAWSARSYGSADFFNQRWLAYTGLAAERALDWGWTDAVHPDNRSRRCSLRDLCGARPRR